MQQSIDKIPGRAINHVCPAYCSRLACNQRQCVVRPESVYGSDRHAAAAVYDSDLLQKKKTTRKAPITGTFGIYTESSWKIM